MSVFKRPVLVSAAALACAAALAAAGPVLSQGANASGAFSADQATRGTATFTETCSNCHGQDFAGGPGTPSLKGPEFMFGWNSKMAGELITYIHDNMPPGGAGSLSDQQYAEIAAAILSANGFKPGSATLAAASAVPIGKP